MSYTGRPRATVSYWLSGESVYYCDSLGREWCIGGHGDTSIRPATIPETAARTWPRGGWYYCERLGAWVRDPQRPSKARTPTRPLGLAGRTARPTTEVVDVGALAPSVARRAA